MQYSNIIAIKVGIDSVIGNFIFDTGSPALVLDSVFYKGLYKKYKTQKVGVKGIGEKSQVANLIVDSLKFKIADRESSFSNKTVVVDLKSFIGNEFDGLLGIDTFKDASFKINFPENTIELTDNLDGFEKIETQVINGRFYIIAEIELANGQKEKGLFLLDTGSSTSTLNNIPHLINAIASDDTAHKFFAIGGIGGESNGYKISTKKIQLGGYSLKKKPIELSTDKSGTYSKKEYSGVIGNDILQHFDVIIDRKNCAIYLKPNIYFNFRNYKDLNLDFDVLDSKDLYKSWIVAGIYEDSDAYKKGIRLNDRIVKIDSVEVFNLNISTWRSTIKRNQKVLISFLSSDNILKTEVILLNKS
jgi:hypothetical protein